MSKIRNEILREAVRAILNRSLTEKKRTFTETIELQVRLKGYNIQKDKRFIGAMKLPHVIRPGLRVGTLGDQVHNEQAQAAGIPFYDTQTLSNFNKEKKAIKYWAKKHHLFLASDSVIKTLNKTLGPNFNKTGKFPSPIRSTDRVADVVEDTKKTVKFRLKKSIAFGFPVANVALTEDQIVANVMTAANYLVTLLKKQWQSIAALRLHSTMGGQAHSIY
jgi:large subunit ribosomal protein L10Ae